MLHNLTQKKKYKTTQYYCLFTFRPNSYTITQILKMNNIKNYYSLLFIVAFPLALQVKVPGVVYCNVQCVCILMCAINIYYCRYV